MKKYIILVIATLLIGICSCSKNSNQGPQNSNLPAGTHAVKVVDFINASNYTYVQCEENGKQYWIAVPQMNVEKGQTLYFAKSMEMKNFHSDALNRTFDSVLFVSDVSATPPTKKQELNEVHSGVVNSPKENISIKPLKDGKTIAQIYKGKDLLNGKEIKVKGEVVKYNPNIMGRNWIHIQDGTESNGNYELMVTSNDKTKVGDIVEVDGNIATNKDFGSGYTYSVMIEDATVKVLK
jgi:GW (Gly-Tryp) dipeptide domain